MIETCEAPGAFNDTSIHFFPEEKLNTMEQKFWIKTLDTQTKTEFDPEIITFNFCVDGM